LQGGVEVLAIRKFQSVDKVNWGNRKIDSFTVESTFLFLSRKALKSRLWASLNRVEKWVRARKIDTAHVEFICDQVACRPHGVIRVDGGCAPQSYRTCVDATYLNVAWITLRGNKHVAAQVYRGRARKTSCGVGPDLECKTDCLSALYVFSPKRAERLEIYLKHRRCRPAMAHLPKPPERMVEVVPDVGGIVLARSDRGRAYVGTPSGWLHVNVWTERGGRRRSAWMALRDFGFSIPYRREKRKWDDKMTAQAALYVLAGLKGWLKG
jgi:hypothetical protein